jgi:hypothetical protein
LFQTQAQRPLHKFQAVNAIAIAEQIAGGARSRETPRPVVARSKPPKANR